MYVYTIDVADRRAPAQQLVDHMGVVEAKNDPTYPASEIATL